MSDPICERVRELAPELALGIAAGEERARALAHLGSCPECRRYVAELAQVADDVLLLVPPAEPPVGFEGRVMRRLARDGTAPRWRRALLAAALVLVAASGGTAATLAVTARDRELGAHYRSTLAQANGQYFGAVPLRGAGGREAGRVFGYQGSPSWVVVVVEAGAGSGAYRVEAFGRDGTRDTLGTMEIASGEGAWTGILPRDLRSTAAIVLRPEEGGPGLEARFRAGSPG